MTQTPISDELLNEWLAFAVRVWKPGIGTIQQCDAPQSFRDWAWSQLGEIKRLRTWTNIQHAEEGEGYATGYPHVHHNENGTTLVLYLDPGDKPADLHIFDGEDVVERITPEKGKWVTIPNGVWHGVLKNHGSKRVAMIATGYTL